MKDILKQQQQQCHPHHHHNNIEASQLKTVAMDLGDLQSVRDAVLSEDAHMSQSSSRNRR